MKTRIILITAPILLPVFGAWAYRYEETFNRAYSLPPGSVVKLIHINGDIHVSTHGGNSVVVEGEKMANSRAYFNDVAVNFVRVDNRLEIRVERKSAECKVEIDFHLKIPARSVALEALTIRGDIEAEGQFSVVRLKTVNGKIEFEGSFTDAAFNTVTNDITFTVEDPLAGHLQADTYNGDIKGELDEDSSFDLQALAVNGKIKSEFPLPLLKEAGGTRARTPINGGTYRVVLKSRNGNLKLLKK